MAQSLVGTLDGLYAACVACYATSTAPDGSPIYVSYGDPGQYQPNGIVAVMNCTNSPIARPTLGTNRSREMSLETQVMVSVYTPGDQTAHQTSLDSVTTLVRLLENYLRVAGNENLSGGCRDSWVSAIEGPVGTVVYDPDSVQAGSPAATGRVVEATATVTALIRY